MNNDPAAKADQYPIAQVLLAQHAAGVKAVSHEAPSPNLHLHAALALMATSVLADRIAVVTPNAAAGTTVPGKVLDILTDFAASASLLTRYVEPEYPPITTVIHAAAESAGRTIASLTQEELSLLAVAHTIDVLRNMADNGPGAEGGYAPEQEPQLLALIGESGDVFAGMYAALADAQHPAATDAIFQDFFETNVQTLNAVTAPSQR